MSKCKQKKIQENYTRFHLKLKKHKQFDAGEHNERENEEEKKNSNEHKAGDWHKKELMGKNTSIKTGSVLCIILYYGY